MEKIYDGQILPKKNANVVILILDKIDFNVESTVRKKFIFKINNKGIIYQGDIAILNLYVTYNISSTDIK